MVYQAITSRTMKLEPDVLEKKRAFVESRLAHGCISVGKSIILVKRGAFFNDILYVLMILEDVRQLRVYSYLPDLPG